MVNCLVIQMNKLIKERKRLVEKLDNTSFLCVKKKSSLKKFISEIDRDIEVLECNVVNERRRLICMGFDLDIPFESKSNEDFEKEYNLLMEIGASMAIDLGLEGIQYVIDDKSELLSLALFDMLYIGSSDMLGELRGNIKRRRI